MLCNKCALCNEIKLHIQQICTFSLNFKKYIGNYILFLIIFYNVKKILKYFLKYLKNQFNTLGLNLAKIGITTFLTANQRNS